MGIWMRNVFSWLVELMLECVFGACIIYLVFGSYGKNTSLLENFEKNITFVLYFIIGSGYFATTGWFAIVRQAKRSATRFGINILIFCVHAFGFLAIIGAPTKDIVSILVLGSGAVAVASLVGAGIRATGTQLVVAKPRMVPARLGLIGLAAASSDNRVRLEVLGILAACYFGFIPLFLASSVELWWVKLLLTVSLPLSVFAGSVSAVFASWIARRRLMWALAALTMTIALSISLFYIPVQLLTGWAPVIFAIPALIDFCIIGEILVRPGHCNA